MKKLGYLSTIAIMACIFQSCSNAPKDSKETADSLNRAKDTVANTMDSMAVSRSDAEFATAAATGGLAEVEFGKIALSKSTRADIKSFAEMMVKDHGKANEELKSLSLAKNIALPTALDDEHRDKRSKLNSSAGKNFDKEYVKMMVDGHKKTLDLMEKEAKNGDDADLKAFAAKVAPIVRKHLELIQGIENSLK